MNADEQAAWDAAKQPFCSVCGATHQIDPPHHIRRRSDGGPTTRENLVTLCRPCHKLTDGNALRFYRDDEDALWWERNDHYGRCVFPDECRQEPCPEVLDEADGETLAQCEHEVVFWMATANRAMWEASLAARDAYFVWRKADCTNRESMAKFKEWASELRDEHYRLRPLAPSTARDMALTAALPDEDAIADMTLRERVRLVKALEGGADYDEARDDIYALSREDYESKYLGKTKWEERDGRTV